MLGEVRHPLCFICVFVWPIVVTSICTWKKWRTNLVNIVVVHVHLGMLNIFLNQQAYTHTHAHFSVPCSHLSFRTCFVILIQVVSWTQWASSSIHLCNFTFIHKYTFFPSCPIKMFHNGSLALHVMHFLMYQNLLLWFTCCFYFLVAINTQCTSHSNISLKDHKKCWKCSVRRTVDL